MKRRLRSVIARCLEMHPMTKDRFPSGGDPPPQCLSRVTTRGELGG